MTNIKIIKITTFFLLTTLIFCEKNLDVKLAREYQGVAPELWMYFAKFEEEAVKRGINIDLTVTGITGSIKKINTHGTVGLCNYKLNTPNHVIIDIDFWNASSENYKEMIIFHELGHCFLERGHKDQAKKDGTCISIMRSGKSDCVDFYNNSNKDEYLDELYTK